MVRAQAVMIYTKLLGKTHPTTLRTQDVLAATKARAHLFPSQFWFELTLYWIHFPHEHFQPVQTETGPVPNDSHCNAFHTHSNAFQRVISQRSTASVSFYRNRNILEGPHAVAVAVAVPISAR
jgi:hypothetical protein